MTLARFDGLAMRLTQELVAERERLVGTARHLEYAVIRRDADDGVQHERRDAKSRIVCNDVGKPMAALFVVRRVSAERIDQDVHVRQDHLRQPLRRK